MAQVLGRLQTETGADPALLVGVGDDAAVYRLDDGTALVFTADFFTPIVDDPFDWGRIAAANALSDVYAMGGRPLLCLNLVGWPREALPLEMLARVLEGGAEVARTAGALVAGGHTVDDPEPKYGMAVVGTVDPERVTRARAAAGDVLVLTKPLGLGVISTAIKKGRAPEALVAEAVRTMTALNDDACAAMLEAGARGATDVTGFGLLGHLQRMAAASGIGARVRASAVPVIEGARDLAAAGMIPGGTRRNAEYVGPWTTFDPSIAETDRILLADAQTSGGLLVACPPDRLAALRAALEARGVTGVEIGSAEEAPAGTLRVDP